MQIVELVEKFEHFEKDIVGEEPSLFNFFFICHSIMSMFCLMLSHNLCNKLCYFSSLLFIMFDGILLGNNLTSMTSSVCKSDDNAAFVFVPLVGTRPSKHTWDQ